MKKTYVYCTVAIGESYFNSACEFAKKLNEKSNEHKVIIVTNQPKVKIKNCTFVSIPKKLTLFYPNGVFNYNLKYYPIKIANNKKFDYIFYFDADWKVSDYYEKEKIHNLILDMELSNVDFSFERPHFIGAKREWDNCFWRHKIEPYKLMETDFYDNGHVCNEQFLAFKNNEKLKVFVDAWDNRDKFSIENNIWPFAEGLEIGMSSIDAGMKFSWNKLHNLSNCFYFHPTHSTDILYRF
jgi:hypothetical protein